MPRNRQLPRRPPRPPRPPAEPSSRAITRGGILSGSQLTSNRAARVAGAHRRASERTLKPFVLDTNVLIHDPRAIFQFTDNEVILPIFVLEEIDQFKKESSERGRNARELARLLDKFSGGGGRLSEGVVLPGGGRLRVATAERSVPHTLRDSQIADYLILMVAVDIRAAHPQDATIFVTKDVNLRIRADSLGLTAVDFDAERVSMEELYSGMTEVPVTGAEVDAFFSGGTLELPNARFR